MTASRRSRIFVGEDIPHLWWLLSVFNVRRPSHCTDPLNSVSRRDVRFFGRCLDRNRQAFDIQIAWGIVRHVTTIDSMHPGDCGMFKSFAV